MEVFIPKNKTFLGLPVPKPNTISSIVLSCDSGHGVDLIEGDLLQIKLTEAGDGSFLRSSDWRLLRLEGHKTQYPGLVCEILDPTTVLQCNNEDNAVRITTSGLYELTLNGLIFQVSSKKS